MRIRHRFTGLILPAMILGLAGGVQHLAAQTPPAQTTPSPEQMTAFAKAYVAISELRDKTQAELALPKNKTSEAQEQVRAMLREGITQIIKDHGLTDVEYRRITLLVSTDAEQRKRFEEIVAELTKKEGGADPTRH